MASKRVVNNRSFPTIIVVSLIVTAVILPGGASGGDLADVRRAGVLRHLGVPYANFVSGAGDGLDVDLMRRFAAHLGVKYQYVRTSWENVIGDLTGKLVQASGETVEIVGEVPVKGDVVANGFTILPWRKQVVDYSHPTFPTQIWLMTSADVPLEPIRPSGDITRDITTVRARMQGLTVLGVPNTCLEPALYNLDEAGAVARRFSGNLNELAPAVISGEAEATLLDVPDALIALEKWPGKVKVIGPLSPMQNMAVAFAKGSPELRETFNRFLQACQNDGTYQAMVRSYYPAVFLYYPDFFKQTNTDRPVVRTAQFPWLHG